MKILIVESCLVEGEKKRRLRKYCYKSKENNLFKAIMDLENNFDESSIVWSNDDFDGECLDSKVIKYKALS